jgi:polysaccharide biosynthesis transport protein
MFQQRLYIIFCSALNNSGFITSCEERLLKPITRRTNSVYSEQSADQNPIRLNRILWTLKRRAGVILGCVLSFFLLSYVFTSVMPPKFKAAAQIIFDPNAEEFVKPDPTTMPSIINLKELERAVALIQSPGTLKEAAATLITAKMNFQPRTPLQRIIEDRTISDGLRLRRLIQQLEKDISIKTDATEQIIDVEYQSKSAEEAAFVANLITKTFIDGRTARRKAAIARATAWLDERTAETKDKLLKVDRKIQDYREEHKLDNDGGKSVYEVQLGQLREQLAKVESKISEAESSLKPLQSISGENVSYTRLAQSVDGVTMEKLRGSLSDAEGELASAKAKYGISHPEVLRKQAQVQAIYRGIEAEAQRKLVTAKNELDALHSQQQELTRNIATAEAKIQDLQSSEVEFRELKRERDATKTLYDTMLTKLAQTAPQQKLASSEFQVILDAAVPEHPKTPPALIWIIGTLMGLIGGAYLSLLLEHFNDRLVHLEDESRLPFKVLARVPAISDADVPSNIREATNGARSRGYRQLAKESPNSLFTNCLLGAQLAVTELSHTKSSQVIMVTSPLQGNGKSLISSNLASLSSILGKRTLLIDLDARKGLEAHAIDKDMENSDLNSFLREAKLSEVLTAACEANEFDVIRQRPSEGAVWLRFFQPQMSALLHYARENYDHVWIDSPPSQLFPDALILAKQVDGFIVIAEWSRTTKRQLKAAQDRISQHGGNILGVIVNKVKVDSLISEAMASYRKYQADADKRSLARALLH